MITSVFEFLPPHRGKPDGVPGSWPLAWSSSGWYRHLWSEPMEKNLSSKQTQDNILVESISEQWQDPVFWYTRSNRCLRCQHFSLKHQFESQMLWSSFLLMYLWRHKMMNQVLGPCHSGGKAKCRSWLQFRLMQPFGEWFSGSKHALAHAFSLSLLSNK